MMNNLTNATSVNISFDNLYPAILECFIIILLGYMAGRTSLISPTHSKGIGTFVSSFCLPALLFKSMCELRFEQVNWTFLSSILIAKTVVFIIIIVISLVIKRPVNLGYAGLFAIFCTQSNDFALGYPILQALYQDTHPDYLQYIYLIAPISLVFLNPIGFTLMEIHKRRGTTGVETGACTVAWQVVWSVVANPIVFMTAIGIAGNFAFKQTVPNILRDILQVLGNAFSATALFYLGLSLVGKVKAVRGIGLLVPILLIGAKTLLLPFVTWEVIGWLTNKDTSIMKANESESLSMYGFLYGTFPTAPSVFLYASQHNIAEDIIATGMVVCTFISAPLMFVSAKMMTVIVNSELDYKSLLRETFFDTSIISIICCVWVMGVLFLSGRWKRIPHRFTMCLIFCQLIGCIGMVMYCQSDGVPLWRQYFQMVLLLVGVFGTRCCTSMVALVMCLIHTRSLCYVFRVQVWLLFFGFGIPITTVGLLFFCGHQHIVHEIDPSFHLGDTQSIFSVLVLLINIILTITALIIRQRNDRLLTPVTTSPPEDTTSPHQGGALLNNPDSSDTWDLLNTEPKQRIEFPDFQKYESCEGTHSFTDQNIEEIIPFPKNLVQDSEYSSSDSSLTSETLLESSLNERTCLLGQCSSEQRRQCQSRLQSYLANTIVIDDTTPRQKQSIQDSLQDEYQTGHHLVLILLLLLSMFIGLFLCVWRMFNKHPTGIYIEVEFLDGVFNYGQGFLIFAVFGFDTRLMFSPLIRRYICNIQYIRFPRAMLAVLTCMRNLKRCFLKRLLGSSNKPI
ncbi:integral membrane protein GPR155-like isoform X2 [Gigantopelta aegis]|uniref:integral membrane protein GPR155-like isoform X2 n=1 Tax=Gigantopelta aegis TaxID=1735272 RepID=UPI001B889D54|nr:integral membrane protein GPR155-like isoform X2 [Gigantopelta aegis]